MDKTSNVKNNITYCQCGCGNPAPIAIKNRPDRQQIKGQALRYVAGHNVRSGNFDSNGPDYEIASNGCWVWQKWIAPNGYGRFVAGQYNKQYAHRVYWMIDKGAITDGLTVHHICHNRKCVNPAHMELLTLEENARRTPHTKLTEASAREIKSTPFYRGINQDLSRRSR
jgi:hypothetical protein